MPVAPKRDMMWNISPIFIFSTLRIFYVKMVNSEGGEGMNILSWETTDISKWLKKFNNEEDRRDTGKTLGINPKTASQWLFQNQEIPKKRGEKMTKQSDEMINPLIIEKKNYRKKPFAHIERVGRSRS